MPAITDLPLIFFVHLERDFPFALSNGLALPALKACSENAINNILPKLFLKIFFLQATGFSPIMVKTVGLVFSTPCSGISEVVIGLIVKVSCLNLTEVKIKAQL